MLKARQQEHSKVRDIEYETLETQSYMVSPIFTNQEVSLLHALRSRSTDCKANFKNKCGLNNQQCRICNVGQEDQLHLLECDKLNNCLKTKDVANSGAKYKDIFSKEVGKHKVITALFNMLFKLREKIIEEQNCQQAPSPTGVELNLSNNLHSNVLFAHILLNK